MARIAVPTKINKPTMSTAKAGRSASISSKPPTKSNKQTAASKRGAAIEQDVSGPTVKVSKDELRTQVQRLEQTNVRLRSKSREMTKAAKAFVTRVAELETQVARFEKGVAARQASLAREPRAKPVASVRGKRQARSVGPNGSVPAETHPDQPGASGK